eukprot:CCRYP_011544-RA/>CCRYP_011544-RA protein AED:0.07 eAED:0.07 QI:492/0.66/0.75/1/1/1/4/67/746
MRVPSNRRPSLLPQPHYHHRQQQQERSANPPPPQHPTLPNPPHPLLQGPKTTHPHLPLPRRLLRTPHRIGGLRTRPPRHTSSKRGTRRPQTYTQKTRQSGRLSTGDGGTPTYTKVGGTSAHLCTEGTFRRGGYYYLILDLIEGGEMFDHLVNHGAYSEADAARLVREVASALDFLHGIGIVHNDVKPENLMLSTNETRDGVIQLVDFGCAHVEGEDDDDDDHDGVSRGHVRKRAAGGMGGFTPAYSSPEAFERRGDAQCLPPVDMWALGVIVYIMLTGIHPFDIQGTATDEEIERDIRNKDLPLPLGPKYSFAKHLSPSAQDLIERLMHRDPKQRISAYEMLHHPWVTGETASTSIMAGSDRRLNKFRKFKTKVQTQFFADAVEWSDDAIVEETRRRTSLIERSFKAFDGSDMAMKRLIKETNPATAVSELVPPAELSSSSSDNYTDNPNTNESMTMSDYSDLLSENMKQKYFPKGHFVYHEGDKGDHMYFINSGTVEVITSDGIKNNRHAGDFLWRRCPVASSWDEVFHHQILREKDKIRRRNRAKALLKLQSGMITESFKAGEELYKEGDLGDSMYILEEGKVDVTTLGHRVIVVTPGNFCGEYSLLTGRLRNTTATCISSEGCVALRLLGRDFRKLMDVQPRLKESLVDMMNRRNFKKAVVLRLGHEFPYSNPREAFDAVDIKRRGELEKDDVAALMREMDEDYSDDEIEKMMETLDLNHSGKVTFDEFKKVFIGDIRTTQSM